MPETPTLRKDGSRWVTDHRVEVFIGLRTLDEVIEHLTYARKEFVPNNRVRVYLGLSAIVLCGDRYATQAEIRAHNTAERAKRDADLCRTRDRIQSALDVLQKEAPQILNRTNVTAEDLLEEAAV